MGFEMVVDATITVGNIIEIGVIAVSGIVAIVTLRNTVGIMKSDLTELKSEMKKVGEVLVRMEATDRRLANAEQDIRDLRRGDGFIRGAHGVDKEYT